MGELTNYSIETDQLVWLSFKSGQNLRVNVGQLPEYLSPHDLKRVRRAIKLRRDFFRNHMPKTLVLAVAVVLATLAVMSGQMVAQIWRHSPEVLPSAGNTEIVRNSLPVAATPTPVANGSRNVLKQVAGAAAVPGKPAVKSPNPRRKSAAPKPAKSGKPAQPGITTSAAGPADPTPSPVPLPTPLPTPTSAYPVAKGPVVDPNAGQVLGDSTGPGATPTPTPTPAPVTAQ